jgi:hypothetical protein
MWLMSDNLLERDLWLLALWARNGLRSDMLWLYVHETAMHWFAKCQVRAQA